MNAGGRWCAKIPHPSRTRAEDHLRSLKRKPGRSNKDRMTVYVCPDCPGRVWHVGHDDPGHRRRQVPS